MAARRIVVTGASRGIGRALAEAYAGPGATLALFGRDETSLAATAASCRARGAEAETVVLDVRDRPAMAGALGRFDAAGPVDLVLANAGIALPARPGQDDAAYDEMAVNYVGALNTVVPLLPAMSARGGGQIAFVSSIAAFAPLPSSPGYSASKAALLSYGLALRERLRRAGVRVSVVCPGYIDTDMGLRYRGWRPFAMSAEAAAARIRHGLARDAAVIAFPRRLAVLARTATLVPEGLKRLGLKAFSFSIDTPPGQG